MKTDIQHKWDSAVAEAVASIVDEGVISGVDENKDIRPKLFDKISGRYLLVDSGASKSIWPVSDFPQSPPDEFRALRAVNNSTIKTFGSRTIKIQPSKNFAFSHTFILAQVSEVVLGWDWLAAAQLDIAWNNNKCFLTKGQVIKAPLKMMQTTPHILNLAPIDVQPVQQTVPTKYMQILDKYPNLTKFNFKKQLPAHNVIHTIETGDSAPCRAKLRPIMPGTKKDILGRKSCEELEQLGIWERVDPKDPKLWASA